VTKARLIETHPTKARPTKALLAQNRLTDMLIGETRQFR
jgi:hypothetical protein